MYTIVSEKIQTMFNTDPPQKALRLNMIKFQIFDNAFDDRIPRLEKHI